MASFRCYDNSDVIKTLLMINFHLHLIKLYMVAVFPNVCLWRRSYSQNWEVLTFICQYGLRYCIVSPSFLVYCFVNIWPSWENFLGKWLNAPPGKKLPVRLCSVVARFVPSLLASSIGLIRPSAARSSQLESQSLTV